MVNKERLLKLADLLLALEPDPPTFSLNAWIKEGEERCGTVCCAIGLAMQDPWFNTEGLIPDKILSGPEFRPTPTKTLRGWEAVEAFFQLESASAFYLFQRQQYEHDPSPAEVAQRIQTLVAELPDHVDRLPPVQH